MKINLREAVIALLIFVVVFAAVQVSMGSYRVEMQSMEPTFLPADCIMVDKLSYRWGSPGRGDVVVLWPPEPYRQDNPYIKRVIGLPGETVRTDAEGQVYIKDSSGSEFLLVEDPDLPPCGVRNRSWALGDGQYFVMGDNRGNSQDSTAFGPVEKEDFVGKTWLRYWPMSRFGLTPHYACWLEPAGELQPAGDYAMATSRTIMRAKPTMAPVVAQSLWLRR